jgi:hypothetical protein
MITHVGCHAGGEVWERRVLPHPDDPFPEGYLLADIWGVTGRDTHA